MNLTPMYGASVGPVVPPAANGGSRWIGALVGGILFLIIGIAQFVIVGSMNDDTAFPDSSGFSDAVMVVPVLTTLVGVVLIVVSGVLRSSEIDSNMTQQAAFEEQMREQQRIKEQERQEMVKAIKSTIMVRCRYCGSLNVEIDLNCASCGANL